MQWRLVTVVAAAGVAAVLFAPWVMRVSATGKHPAEIAPLPNRDRQAALSAAVGHSSAGTTALPASSIVLSGVPAYAPAGVKTETEMIDAARQLGIPTVRTTRFPSASPAAFFCTASLADRQFARRLRTYVAGGRRALLTSTLAGHLGRLPSEFADRVFILPARGGAQGVLALPQAQVDRLRNFVLYPLGLRMEAPPRVSLTLVGREALVVENQNAFAAGVKLTFLPARWPGVRALTEDHTELPLMGSTVSLQTPPKTAQRFQILSRE